MIDYLNGLDRKADQRGLRLLETVDFLRLDATRRLDKERKVSLGQFFTPAPVASLLASMLECTSPVITLLDAGAGVGSLFSAYVAYICQKASPPERISVVAYEIDELLFEYLQETLHLCQELCEQSGIQFTGQIIQKDFIAESVEMLDRTLFSPPSENPAFHCALLNPPYRKIQTTSLERKLLQRIGVETSNLYAGFLAIVTQLLAPTGELVAITPRSFCNGPYFKNFRKNFLNTMSLRRLHIYDSREKAFHDNEVLQENIILRAVKEQEKPSTVQISSSSGPQDDLILVHEVEYEQVVHRKDPEAFIHLLQDDLSEHVAKEMSAFQTKLGDLGFQVSTGRVIDFRATDFLRPEPEPGTVPLLFPTHVNYGSITWPKRETKKPNALLNVAESRSLQVPNEYYVLVKRFSAKEEKKRIVAALYDPTTMPGPTVGFENHLNYFHQNGRGLAPTLAHGLVAYLNATLVDSYFRQFNGHTQVNATDLRNIAYPSRQQLEALGKKFANGLPPQHELDQIIREELFSMSDQEEGSLLGNDPIKAKQKIEEAQALLKDLGLPSEQQNERSALTIAPGKSISLSPGGQNILVEQIINNFAPCYTPGGKVLYVGDTDTKFAYFDEAGFATLGVSIQIHGKMPDVIIHYLERDWLVLIEAVTSHGPIDSKRKDELTRLFQRSSAKLVFVTAFLTRKAMIEYLKDISWETEVWVADAPTHLIHFNGERLSSQ